MEEKWVASLDVGATHVTAGLASSWGKVTHESERKTRDEGPPLKERIVSTAKELCEKAARSGIRLEGAAAGVPGIVDSEKGLLVAAGLLPELSGFPLGPELEKALGLPALIENDVNAQACAEMIFGQARGVSNFVFFSIGTDLGGGLVIGGKLIRGAHHLAAEYGHITLDLEGQRCACGASGCASHIVSGAGLARRAAESRGSGSGEKGMEPGAEDVFAAARRGERAEQELADEFKRRFGVVAANVMKVVDPQMVVFAGPMMLKEPGLFEEVVSWAKKYYFPVPWLPEFRVSNMTKDTAVLGPAAAFFMARNIPAGPGNDP